MAMKAWLYRLLEPVKTSPTDSFKWRDKRTISQQVSNGFRIAGGLVGGFLVMLATLAGLARFSVGRTAGGFSVFTSWTSLVVAAIVVLLTAHRWAPFVTGFFFGPATLKMLGILVFNSDSYYSSHSITRLAVIELLAYSVAVIWLTWRFVGERPAPTTVLDRLALTFFVFTTAGQMITPIVSPWFLISGGLRSLLLGAFIESHERKIDRDLAIAARRFG